MQLLQDEPELAERLGEVPVAVIEKGWVPGAPELSGAIMRPSAFATPVLSVSPFACRTSWPLAG